MALGQVSVRHRNWGLVFKDDPPPAFTVLAEVFVFFAYETDEEAVLLFECGVFRALR